MGLLTAPTVKLHKTTSVEVGFKKDEKIFVVDSGHPESRGPARALAVESDVSGVGNATELLMSIRFTTKGPKGHRFNVGGPPGVLRRGCRGPVGVAPI
jgi:hypothetical protein